MRNDAKDIAARAASVLLGLALSGLALAWSVRHPPPIALTIESPSFGLGTTPRGEYRRHSWAIVNGGGVPLRLRTRFTSGRCGFSLWLGEDHVIPAWGRLTVSLTCPTPLRPAVPFSAHVDVITDDPEYPKIRFRVYGITGPPDLP